MIKLCSDPFEPLRELEYYQADVERRLAGKYGATALFIGTMRDFNDGDSVSGLFLDHYPGMTEKQLERIVERVRHEQHLLEALVVHRVGMIEPGQPIVLVAVWSAHRGNAFDGARFIMEALKNQAPFWKKERLADGTERWVQHNTDGYSPNLKTAGSE